MESRVGASAAAGVGSMCPITIRLQHTFVFGWYFHENIYRIRIVLTYIMRYVWIFSCVCVGVDMCPGGHMHGIKNDICTVGTLFHDVECVPERAVCASSTNVCTRCYTMHPDIVRRLTINICSHIAKLCCQSKPQSRSFLSIRSERIFMALGIFTIYWSESSGRTSYQTKLHKIATN